MALLNPEDLWEKKKGGGNVHITVHLNPIVSVKLFATKKVLLALSGTKSF